MLDLLAALVVASSSSPLLAPAVQAPVVELLVGDDNGDGVIVEDESGWDCATMGNLRCG